MTRLWDMLHNDGRSSIKDSELNSLRTTSEHKPKCHTDAESEHSLYVTLLYQLYTLYYLYEGKPMLSSTGDHVRSIVTKFAEWEFITNGSREERLGFEEHGTVPIGENLVIPDWRYFHERYSSLELIGVTVLTMEYVMAKNHKIGSHSVVDQEWLKTKITKIVRDCRKTVFWLQHSVKEFWTEIAQDSTIRELEHELIGRIGDSTDSLGHELQCFDSEASKKICENIRESWISGLNGITLTKFL